LFEIRPAQASDVEAVYSILSDVACRVPVDLSTPERVRLLKSQIDECCRDGLSFVAVDKNDAVVAFQLAKREHWNDDVYIHLIYAGVTAAASGKKIFKRLIEAEKMHGLPLQAVVKPRNKSEMVARLTHYGFRPYSHPALNDSNRYRWEPG
jgi:L-amino acid N-acyltransferase YncA